MLQPDKVIRRFNREFDERKAEEKEKDMPTNKFKSGDCELCKKENTQVMSNNGIDCCQNCLKVQAAVQNRPETVVAEIVRVHGDKYFDADDLVSLRIEELELEVEKLVDRNIRQLNLIGERDKKIKELREGMLPECEECERVCMEADMDNVAWRLAEAVIKGDITVLSWTDIETLRGGKV